MRNSIYEIAVICKAYSDKNVRIINYVGNRQLRCVAEGANKYYESILFDLCDAIKVKYPYISLKLRNHIENYDNSPIKHQCVIDEYLDYLIKMETPSDDNRKFFISHASADKNVINSFVDNILILGCGFRTSDIFCTLDHSVIRTGDDFRNEIIENMKNCDYIMCFISNNYKQSEVCQNEMGAAWVFNDKRVLPFKFPDIKFNEIGFLNKVKQSADITDGTKLDELYEELCDNYNLQQDWKNFNRRKEEFIKLVNEYCDTSQI
ncbi:MAG: toll/interleukin-1 receptor domain-containing protein [Bacteroidales bacterium]|nr:toll/interleukin-1 receptor domain-containing protein [Bacteroidales bacterium]MBR6177906.1 toll/interleukin-1 receptor domain-containing protein [Bacteroidales bacterium]